MSESTQERPDQADEQAPKPGEQDTETVAGQPRKAPEATKTASSPSRTSNRVAPRDAASHR